ncbi:stage II sporulation protein D [Paenibacillaceae bacterium GAS479]|nr:stage II sporulation protein D [Paenibacillaceae bacterium GAS479]
MSFLLGRLVERVTALSVGGAKGEDQVMANKLGNWNASRGTKRRRVERGPFKSGNIQLSKRDTLMSKANRVGSGWIEARRLQSSQRGADSRESGRIESSQKDINSKESNRMETSQRDNNNRIPSRISVFNEGKADSHLSEKRIPSQDKPAGQKNPPLPVKPWPLAAVSILTAAAILIPGLIVQRQEHAQQYSTEQTGYGASSAPGAERQPMFAASSGTLVPLLGAAGGAPGSEAAYPGGANGINPSSGGGANDKGTASSKDANVNENFGGATTGSTPPTSGQTGVGGLSKAAAGSGAPAGGNVPPDVSPTAPPGGSVLSRTVKKQTALPLPGALDRMTVRVYLTAEKRVEKVPMELYVRGVIAGEMPVSFEPEALKAQAIAARTYLVKRLASGDRSGMPVKNADVTDTTAHQVYVPLDKLLDRWSGKDREVNLAKLNAAVQETRGQIITYEGKPIEALFFSTSNGYTENSEDYWGSSLPYLRSVASPWDKKISPEFKETTSMSLAAFYQKLGISGKTPPKSLRVLDTTDGKRIREMTAGSKVFTGRQMREKLGLASTQFTWKIEGKEIEITTYGYGHGVGMSQWGADGMAKSGSTAYQILSHYYTGTEVVRTASLPKETS